MCQFGVGYQSSPSVVQVADLEILLRRLRRLEVVKSGIETQKDKELNIARTKMEMAIARIEREIKWWATLLPPIPTLILALVLLAHRRKRERVGIPKGRLVGG